MKCNSLSLRGAFKITVLSVSFAIAFISAGRGLNAARAQDLDMPRLTLVMRDNGFDGLYTLDGKAYKIENWVSKEKFRTRILRPDGSSLIETSNESEALIVLLPTGRLEVDIAKPSTFSTEETRALQAFTQSDDCALVKKIVIEVFKKRAVEKPSLLGGFSVISMFLGE